MSENSYDPDKLKPLDFIDDPDPRSFFFEKFDPDEKIFKTITLSDHHQAISRYSLLPPVPEKIITHFETAKNIYLYAWFVYRFYPVADFHVRATLELALKYKIGKGNLKKASQSVGKNPGLNAYILYAIQQGWVQNEGFQRWWDTAYLRAKDRVQRDLVGEMERTGDAEAFFDPSQVKITEQDKKWNLLETISKSIPAIRNEYGHGSSMLHSGILSSFELIAEFINQLWPAGSQGEI